MFSNDVNDIFMQMRSRKKSVKFGRINESEDDLVAELAEVDPNENPEEEVDKDPLDIVEDDEEEVVEDDEEEVDEEDADKEKELVECLIRGLKKGTIKLYCAEEDDEEEEKKADDEDDEDDNKNESVRSRKARIARLVESVKRRKMRRAKLSESSKKRRFFEAEEDDVPTDGVPDVIGEDDEEEKEVIYQCQECGYLMNTTAEADVEGNTFICPECGSSEIYRKEIVGTEPAEKKIGRPTERRRNRKK